MSIIAWTGHRPDLFRDPQAAREAVQREALALLNAGTVSGFLVGGQRGVDTWAAQAAIDLGIPFTLYLPLAFEYFTEDWSESDRQVLREHLRYAQAVHVVGGYSERNRLLATSADLLVVVWTGQKSGGTAETFAFAEQRGTEVRVVLLDASDTAGSARGRGI